VPSQPENVEVQNSVNLEDAKKTLVRVKWLRPKEPNGPIDGYEVKFVGGSKEVPIQVDRENTFVETTELEAYTDYTVTVEAYNDYQGHRLSNSSTKPLMTLPASKST